MTNLLQKVAQRKDASEVFEKAWEGYGFKGVNAAEQSKRTVPIQRIINTDDEEQTKTRVQKLDTEKLPTVDGEKSVKGLTRKKVGEMQAKAMDSGEVENYVPLVFDPEIVSLQKQEAPILDRISQEGQEGYQAVFNVVDSRDRSEGFGTEADVLDMSGDTASDVQLAKDNVDMTIWRRKVTISDFTQAAANHYMNVEDTTVGEGVAQHAQEKASSILYGDPSLATGAGYIGDENGYKGLAQYAADRNNDDDKSTVSQDFVPNIKAEVSSMLQNENVSANELLIGVSWDMYDQLENEADYERSRTDGDTRSVSVGLDDLRIKGVPVMPSHNIGERNAIEEVTATDTTNEVITVPNDYTTVLASGDTVTLTADDGTETDLTVSGVSYDSSNDETDITVSEDLTSDRTGESASFTIAGDNGDVFIFSERTARYRALMPLSMVPLAKTGLSDTMAMAEFGAFIDKSQGAFVRFLSAYDI